MNVSKFGKFGINIEDSPGDADDQTQTPGNRKFGFRNTSRKPHKTHFDSDAKPTGMIGRRKRKMKTEIRHQGLSRRRDTANNILIKKLKNKMEIFQGPLHTNRSADDSPVKRHTKDARETEDKIDK